jgi:hypothetical protein
MSAPAVLKEVFVSLRSDWGEEDDGFTFEDGPGPMGRIDVFVYRPTAEVDMTSFATIGMAAAHMPSAGRAELRFACRGRFAPSGEAAVAAQLANLAAYPWTYETHLNWGHFVGMDRDFPGFPDCPAVFLSGPFTDNARSHIPTADGSNVRLLNVVPVTAAERLRGKGMVATEFIRELMSTVDIFSARPRGQGSSP